MMSTPLHTDTHRQPFHVIVRWTIGDVSDEGFDILRWSLLGARRLFGDRASYVVCVNSISAIDARDRVGPLGMDVVWRSVRAGDIPGFLRDRFDDGLAEGVGWKFAPLHMAERTREIALDNDCVLWRMPEAMAAWIDDPDGRALLAEDVRPCFGQFTNLCGPEPRNSGIRGLPARFPLEDALRDVLDDHPVTLASELDEQGLQVAALERRADPLVVDTRDVTICSPFAPHQRHLGRCGAHFVGLNAKSLSWSYEGRPAVAYIREHWHALKREVAHLVASR
jgi:hypothetical protein